MRQAARPPAARSIGDLTASFLPPPGISCLAPGHSGVPPFRYLTRKSESAKFRQRRDRRTRRDRGDTERAGESDGERPSDTARLYFHPSLFPPCLRVSVSSV